MTPKPSIASPTDMFMNRKSPLRAIKDAMSKITSLGVRNVTAADLSEFSDDLGDQIAGRFIAPALSATSTEPTDADFTGSFMSGAGETFGNDTYNIGGVNAGALQWGASQTNGKLNAAEGMLSLDNNGMTVFGRGVAIHWGSATTNLTQQRTGTFVGGVSYGALNLLGLNSFFPNGAAIVSEDFEGGLSEWTLTGTPEQSSDYAVSGSYSCKVDKNNYITKTVAVTQGAYYLISLKVRKTGATSYFEILDGTRNTILGANTNSWTLLFLLYYAPSTGNVDFVFKNASFYGNDPTYLDDICIYRCWYTITGTESDNAGTYNINGNAISLRADSSISLTVNGRAILGTHGVPMETGLANRGYSGIYCFGITGVPISCGDLIYFDPATSKWLKTDANAEATAGPVKIGICLTDASADNAITILLWGNVRADSVFPALTIGGNVYMGTVAGSVQTTAPSGTADIVRIIGKGNTADELFFCPDQTYIEVA